MHFSTIFIYFGGPEY